MEHGLVELGGDIVEGRGSGVFGAELGHGVLGLANGEDSLEVKVVSLEYAEDMGRRNMAKVHLERDVGVHGFAVWTGGGFGGSESPKREEQEDRKVRVRGKSVNGGLGAVMEFQRISEV